MRTRYLAAALLFVLSAIGAFALLRVGRYGWTAFVFLPVLLGGLTVPPRTHAPADGVPSPSR